MKRHEYLIRSKEFSKRGEELPGSALLAAEVIEIRKAHAERIRLLKHIRDELGNEALAKKYKVHKRTIEKIVRYETWVHLL